MLSLCTALWESGTHTKYLSAHRTLIQCTLVILQTLSINLNVSTCPGFRNVAPVWCKAAKRRRLKHSAVISGWVSVCFAEELCRWQHRLTQHGWPPLFTLVHVYVCVSLVAPLVFMRVSSGETLKQSVCVCFFIFYFLVAAI